MGLKIILGSILAVVVLLGFIFIKPYLGDNYQIVKTYRILDDLNIVFIEDDATNLYILNNYDLKHFENSKSMQKNLILKTKQIYVSDINVRLNNNLTIEIKKNKYLYGKILHFQNYFTDKNLKETKIILEIKE